MDHNPFLNDLFLREYPNLYRYALRLAGDEERAKDLVQETFMAALFHQEELLRHPAPEGWLKKAALNLIRNQRRKQARYAAVPLEELPAHLLAREDAGPLDEILPAALSQEDRTLLIWRFEEQLDYPTIARRLGISQDSARARVSRAVRRCRREWGRPDSPEGP